MDFLTTLIQVLILLALAVPGFILKKLKLMNDFSVSTLVNILMYVALPFLLVESFLTNKFTKETLVNMGITVGFALLCMLILFVISHFIYKFNSNVDESKVYKYATIFSNCGFMGIPVIEALMHTEGSLLDGNAIIYVAVFNVVFNLLNWTFGVYILSGDKKYISFKKAFLNPATIAVLIGLPFFFCNVELPEPIIRFTGLLGGITTPLAMIITGIRLAEIPIKEIFKGWGTYGACALRLVVAPVIMFLILMPFEIDITVKAVLIAIMAMPCAVTAIAFCELVETDSMAAVKCVLLTTVLSCITIPLMLYLLI